MNINPLASSSLGNCYMVSDGVTTIMIECGLPMNDLKIRTNFFNPRPQACFVSHSHKDHSQSVEKLLAMGIDCYMSKFTKTELDIDSPFLHLMSDKKEVIVGTMSIVPLQLFHDAYCLGFYILSTRTNETLFFATDTYMLPYKFRGLDYIMVEANYEFEIVNEAVMSGDYPLEAKERLVRAHMEVGNTVNWLEQQDLSQCKKIYILHLSNNNSNAESIKRKVIEATGVPTVICKE